MRCIFVSVVSLWIVSIGELAAYNNVITQLEDDDYEIFENKFDVLITQEPDQSISGHLAVLAASIPYFSALDIKETSELVQIDLSQDIELSAVETLFQFAYSQRLRIDQKNVEALLKAALFLRMNNVVDACSSYLIPRFKPHSVVNILNTAESKHFALLKSKALDYIQHNFVKVAESDAILDLNTDTFFSLIRSNDLHLLTEEPVFEASIRWIKHDQKTRSAMAWQVLQNIRFPLLSLQYLATNVSTESLVKQSIQVRELVDEAIHFNLLHEEQNRWQGCRKWSRNGTAHFFVLDYEEHNLQIVDPIEKQFETGQMTTARQNFAAAANECHIYAIGGESAGKVLSTVEKYNAMSDSWEESEPMNGGRKLAAATTMNNQIYISGGENDGHVLNTAEFYNPNTNTWSTVAPMLQPRLGHQLVVFGGDLYAVGGRKHHDQAVNSLEQFDTLRNTWSWATPMLVERQAMGVAELNGKLYVCGGFQQFGTFLDSAEVFDPVVRTWKLIAPMTVPRKWFSLLAHKDKLYAVGGSNVNGHLNSVDIYDPETNTWDLKGYLTYPAEAITVMLHIV